MSIRSNGFHEPLAGRRRQASRGQIMPLFVLVITSLIAIVGLAVDGSSLYSAQRSAQAAADLAALAAALDLPGSPSAAAATALSYASKNGHPNGGSITVTATTPYGADGQKILIVVQRQVSTLFLPIVGMRTVTISARAVAKVSPRRFAIFAGRSSCSAGSAHETITISSSNATVTGNVHSNSGMKISGSNNDMDGTTTYKCQSRLEISGSGNTFTSGPTVAAAQDWPVTYDSATLPCTYSLSSGTDIGSDDGAWWMPPGKSSNALRPGVYCTTGELKLSASGLTGNITMLAKGTGGKVIIAGSNVHLTPYWNGVLAFSTGTGPDAILLSGSGGDLQGLLYAPAGRVSVSGSNNMTISGGILANEVTLSGSNWELDAGGSGGGVALVE